MRELGNWEDKSKSHSHSVQAHALYLIDETLNGVTDDSLTYQLADEILHQEML